MHPLIEIACKIKGKESGTTGGATDTRPLHHLRLLERFRVAQEFPDEDQEALIRIIDAMIAQYRTRSAMASLDRPKKKSEKV